MAAEAYLYPDASLGLGPTVFAVDAAGTDIGRHSESALCLPIDSISRHHARLEHAGERWVLTDLGSSNGTFVNGERIEAPVELVNGDVIMFGKAELTFRCSGSGCVSHESSRAGDESSGLRLVGDDESSSVIISTKLSDNTPFTSAPVVSEAREHLDMLNQRLLALYRLSDVLRGASRRESIIAALLNLVFENLPADRGVVMRLDEATDQFEPEQFHFRDGLPDKELVVSRTIMRRAVSERVAVLSRDVRADASLQASESMMASDIRSAMCVPLAGKRHLMGLLFLDTREALHAFTEDDLAFVSALATDAAMTLENLELMEENLRHERLAAVGQAISGLAHNIKNILQLARGGTELMDLSIKRQNFEEIETLWPITRRSIERMQTLTQEMLDFSRHTEPELSRGDVNEVVKNLVELIEAEAQKKQVALTVDYAEDCGRPMINADNLQKAMMNLLTNAFDALAGRKDSTVHIVTETRHGHCVICIRDNGPGIPPELQARVFQPFFSTKGSQGNGLGLAMTRKYIEDMGARLELAASSDAGCEFTIIFPSPAGKSVKD